jgi:PAS domain S-box-containing protein
MAIPNSQRQKNWRNKQKDKQQVTVMLSKASYGHLKNQSEETGRSYSNILDEEVIKHSLQANHLMIDQSISADELKIHYSRLDESMSAFTNEMTMIKQHLENEMTARMQAERSFQESEEKFRLILENSYDVIFRANLNEDTYDYISPSSKMVFGYTPDEIKAIGFKKLRTFIHPDDHERFTAYFKEYTKQIPSGKDQVFEHRFKHKTLGYRWMSSVHTLLFDESNQPMALVGSVRDIHRGKQAEIELRKLHGELEMRVNERTQKLEEANTALRLMLKKEEEVKSEIEEEISGNVRELVSPYIERLKMARLNYREKEYLEIAETNLNDILSPFLTKMSSKIMNITPGEIQVANLVKNGKTTKEMAELLNLSTKTIEFHRANIRKKAGIKNQKINLRSFLLSFA